jgi:hypothetical protein
MKSGTTTAFLGAVLFTAACQGQFAGGEGNRPGNEDESNIGQVEQAVLLPAAAGPTGFVRGDGILSILARGADNHVWEMAWLNNNWSTFDLSLQTPTTPPNATGTPTGYFRGAGGVNSVVYRSTSSGGVYRIIELFLVPGQGWGWGDLTAITGAPSAGSSPNAFLRAGGIPSIVYRSTANDIIEISGCPGWVDTNLRAVTGAPKAQGGPMGYLRHASIPAVVYRSDANQVIELTYYNGGWGDGNLSAISGAPTASSDPVGYARSKLHATDYVNSVVYRASNHHIIEIYLAPGGNWGFGDLTKVASAPLATGTPFGYQRHDGIISVVYRGRNDIRIYEIALISSGWVVFDLMAAAGASQLSASSPKAFTTYNSSSVIYRGQNGRIYEMRGTSSGWTTREAS